MVKHIKAIRRQQTIDRLIVGLRLKGLTSTIKHLEQVLCKAARDTSSMKYVTK